MSIEERLEEVEGLLQKTNDWIAQQLRPGIRNLKEAMQTQITELREQLEEERNARLALERKLASQPDVAAINALIAEQLKKHAASLASSSSSSSSSSSHSSSSPHSSSASPSVADARAAFSESSDDLFSMNNQAPRTSSSSSSFSSSSSSSSSTSNRPLSSTFVAPGTSFVPSSSTPASGGARTPAGRPAVGPARGPASSQPSPKPAPAPAPEPVLTETEKRVAEAGLQQFAAALRDLPLEKLALLEESEYGSYGVNLAPHKKALTTLITALQTELGIAPKPSEVDEKLASIGLDRFANNFRQAGIKTVKQLAQLDGSQYASLGISLPAHRKKLATLILTLQTEEEGDEEDESLELFPTPKPAAAAAATPKFGAASSFASPKVASGSSTPLSGSSTPLGSSGSSTPAARVRPVSTYDLPRSTASIADAVRDIRDDSSETDWVLLELGSGGIGVVFEGSGSGGFDEFIDHISEGKIQFALLRLIQGDQESRRVKFVFVRWVGPACNGILKAKANTLKSEVTRLLGQFHIEHFAEDFSELTLEIIKDKLKAAAGADYDQGNKGGYSSSASSLKARALDTYRTKEREGTISKPVFASSALPSTTPCDISSRPFVAPPAEARSNIRGY